MSRSLRNFYSRIDILQVYVAHSDNLVALMRGQPPEESSELADLISLEMMQLARLVRCYKAPSSGNRLLADLQFRTVSAALQTGHSMVGCPLIQTEITPVGIKRFPNVLLP